MLGFKFFLGLKFSNQCDFNPYPFVSDYDNKYKTMKNKNQTGVHTP